MSADIPVGPELDRAVALALGWTEQPRSKGWWYPPLMTGGRSWRLRRYSTDPRLQDELLAAILTTYDFRRATAKVKIILGAARYATASVWDGTRGRSPKGDGPTISVALCRLLLAVKGAS